MDERRCLMLHAHLSRQIVGPHAVMVRGALTWRCVALEVEVKAAAEVPHQLAPREGLAGAIGECMARLAREW